MKKSSLRLAAALSLMAVSLSAVAQIDFQTSKAKGYYIGKNDAGVITVALSANADFVMPEGTDAGLKNLDAILEGYAGLRIEDGKLIVADEYLRGVKSETVSAEEFKKALASKPESAYNLDAKITKAAETDKYLTMRVYTNTKSLNPDLKDYSHVDYINYNKATGEVIDYFDIFNASAERQLRQMMYPIIAKKLPLTIKSPDEMEIVQNFALSPKGVTFCFPESEIAAGNLGCPEIFLTWQQLRSHNTLAEGAEELVGLK